MFKKIYVQFTPSLHSSTGTNLMTMMSTSQLGVPVYHFAQKLMTGLGVGRKCVLCVELSFTKKSINLD